jgi:outer membrane protein OmpA-like peptidoglycan-associated protein
MYYLSSSIILMLLFFLGSAGEAGELPFPQRQNEIVDALTLQNEKTTVDGATSERDNKNGVSDLSFPRTRDEIINALAFKNKKAFVDGVMYERNKNGEVFQVIDGERYRMRAIRARKKVAKKVSPIVGVAVNFKSNSDVIAKHSYSILNEFGKALGDNKLAGGVFHIDGHADSRGSDNHNLNLSKKRAAAVKRYLVDVYGINHKHLKTFGYGETQPVASNQTPEGRSKNRRVEFIRVE